MDTVKPTTRPMVIRVALFNLLACPVFPNQPQVQIERWVMWRRVAGSLTPDQLRYLEEVVPIAQQEEQALFGESLPVDLILHGQATAAF